jgi:diphthamide synthase (EF-2-diphthine--ammonia ligase)
MLAGGLEARLCCVDSRQLDPAFVGRAFDAALLAKLPAAVDPCGERGEFHTFVHAGPMFDRPIAIEIGDLVHGERFAFAEVRPAGEGRAPGARSPTESL